MKSINKFNKKGQRHGKWHHYYNDGGKLYSSGYYTKDDQQGKWLFYYPSGKMSVSGSFNKGNPIGLWEVFHDTGMINRQEIYLT